MKYLNLILIICAVFILSCKDSSGTISKYNPDKFLDEKNKDKILLQLSKVVFDPGYSSYIQEDERGNLKKYEVDSAYFKKRNIKFDSFSKGNGEESKFFFFIYYPQGGFFAHLFNGSGGSFTMDSNFHVVNVQEIFRVSSHESEEEVQREGREAFEVMLHGGDIEKLIKEENNLFSPDRRKEMLKKLRN